MSPFQITTSITCPKCSGKTSVDINTTPFIRSKLKPADNIIVYRITSEDIKRFLIGKARFYKPEVELDLASYYCERKNKDPHRGYASFKIAFSDDVEEKPEEYDWFDKIGNTNTNVRFVESIYKELIKRYGYSRKDLDDILRNYKKLEYLENKYGITESYINDIRLYTIPQRIVQTNANRNWILFSARADRIIEDMLEDPTTNKVNGFVEIHDVNPINEDNVEFIVYLHHGKISTSENPLVRQLVTKSKKSK